MTATGKQWTIHTVLAVVGVIVASLVHASADGTSLNQHDFLTAAQAGIAYLVGVLMKSPNDARDPGTATRSTDPAPPSAPVP